MYILFEKVTVLIVENLDRNEVQGFFLCFRLGLSFDIAVEDLKLKGTLQAIVHMSMDIPFPHITKATVSFSDT